MNRSIDKPTIFVPIEIKARELNSKILFALRAAERNYRVYIGTKDGIRDLLRERSGKSGIYFYKSGSLRGRLDIVKKHCQSLIVLDEERGVAVDKESFVNAYHRTEDHQFIDKYFVISEKHKRILGELRPAILDKICVTGWPRVDLWRKEFNAIHDDEVKRIKDEYGTFFLFSSDFGRISEGSIERSVKKALDQYESHEVAQKIQARYRRFLDEFRSFVGALQEIESDPQFPRIIIRPHPGEEHGEWYRALKGFRKIKVVYQGEITPWLLASEGVVHRGCTTAVQSYFSGKPTFLLLPYNREVDVNILPYKLSAKVHDMAELKKHLLSVLDGSYTTPAVDADIEDEISVRDRLACDRILDHVDQIAVADEPPVSVSNTARMKIALREHIVSLRDNVGFLRDDYKANKRISKMRGGISSAEIANVAGKIADLRQVDIRDVVSNVVVLEKV